MKKCSKCREDKALAEFAKNRSHVDGFDHYCRLCNSERLRSVYHLYAEKKKAYYQSKKEWILARNARRRVETNGLYDRQYWEKNKERISKRLKAYVENNRHRINSAVAWRRALIRKATPSWSSREKIDAIYKEASLLGLHVDHIYPLVNDKLCGLHVEWNLQLLTPAANRQKWNKVL